MIDLSEYGYHPNGEEIPDDLLPARVIEEHRGEIYKVVCARGEVDASLAGAFYHGVEEHADFPAVGDFVLMKYNETGSSRITRLIPRRTKFSRTNFQGHAAGYVKTVVEQVVAANFDTVFILSSMNHDFNVNRIARYLTATRQSGALPVVVLSKADLCDQHEPYLNEVRKLAPDAPVIAVSCVTLEGFERLSEYIHPGQTVVFLGMSGVGKSSLLNALAGEQWMAVREIREDDARGRHTTTHRQLFRLPSGAMVIDTPGMRELGLWDAQEGIGASFADVEDLAAQCRFSNCAHKTEPGCAVLAALEDGSLSPAQWKNYQAQMREAAFIKSKSRRRS